MFARFFLSLICVVALSVWGCATTASNPKTAKDPKKAESSRYFTMGLMEMNHGNWDKAEKNFLEALKINPKGYNTRLYLAKVYENQRKPDKAVEQIREVIRQTSKDSRPYSMLMSIYDNSGQTDKAIAVGEEAIQNGAAEDTILCNLGWFYYISGDYDKAQARLKAAMESSKNNSIIYNNMGLVNFSQGRYEDALAVFKEAERLQPKSTLTPYFLALTYKKLGHDDEALEALRVGLKNDPALSSKVKEINKQFFPHADPGDLSELFKKAQAEIPPTAPPPAGEMHGGGISTGKPADTGAPEKKQ